MFGELCVRCKGRLWCGLPKCPLIEATQKYLPKIKFNPSEIFGISPPSLFVGRFGYPRVYAGPLISEGSPGFTNTSELYGKPLDFVLSKTAALIRVAASVDVKKPSGKIVESTQEISMSVKPIDTEIKVEKVSNISTIDTYFHPTGPRVIARKVDIVDNPSIPKKVDMVWEERLKANHALVELYKYNFPIDYLQRLLSAGVLGREKKLVPTRWSITAVDDAIAKHLLKEVKHQETVDKVEYYHNTYMGNIFHILLIPGAWEYEMLEMWLKGAIYAPESSVVGADYEPYYGRKDYASQITGAYYAARLAILEHLFYRRRQARVLIYREILPDYKIPLGVWIIRESVRHALSKTPVIFEDASDAIKNIKKNTANKNWAEKSTILRKIKTQKTLDSFI